MPFTVCQHVGAINPAALFTFYGPCILIYLRNKTNKMLFNFLTCTLIVLAFSQRRCTVIRVPYAAYTVNLKRIHLSIASAFIRSHPTNGVSDPWGELSYLAPLGSENFSSPYFKQCFFQGGALPPQTVKHHASQSQDRNNKYFILYIEFCINNKI